MIGINMTDDIKVTDDYKPGDTLVEVVDCKPVGDIVHFVIRDMFGDGSKRYALMPITTDYNGRIDSWFRSLENMQSYYRGLGMRFAKCDVSINVRLNR